MARTRLRRHIRSVLAGLLACGLLASAAAMAEAGHRAALTRTSTPARPLSAVYADLTAYQVTSGTPGAVTPARAADTAAWAQPPVLTVAVTPGSVAAPALAGCAFWNISCQVDAWFSGLIVSALTPLLNVVGQTGLSTPQVSSAPAVSGMWAASLGVADAIFVLLILAGGMILMGYQTYQSSYTLKEVAPRLVIAMVAANASLLVIPKAISLSNAMSAAMAPGLSQGSATSALTRILMNGQPGSGIFLILLSLVAVVLAAAVAVTYVIRLMAVVLLIGAAPLALAGYALPHTSWAARWW